MPTWSQIYDPLGNPWASTLLAAFPLVLLLILIATGRIKPHLAAGVSLAVAMGVAVFGFGMPLGVAGRAAGLGAVTGFFPIGWIIINVIFLYRLTVERGWFGVIQASVGGVTEDRRLQLLLVAFCFGAFFEGAAGFGTPVAITAAILLGLGFSPLAAAGLSLIANTAPVAFGALGAPVQGLATATGLDPILIGQMIGRQVSLFSLIVPFWLVWAFAGRKGMLEIWPAILVCGLSFAIPQFLVSNFINPWIVDLVASVVSMLALAWFLRIWKPATIWTSPKLRGADISTAIERATPGTPHAATSTVSVWVAALPWIILCVVLTFWASSGFKAAADSIFAPAIPVPGLDKAILRVPPIVAAAAPEAGVFKFTALSYTGTGILAAALLSSVVMGMSPVRVARIYAQSIWSLRHSLVTIMLILALGTLTKYAGIDATLGLAFAKSGTLYPFFGTLLGWLGVAATGSDTASNLLFGGLQKITAEQLGIPVILMAAANSTGGVMGKMIDTQSIVVASTATGWFGHEGKILRFVFFHSIALACLVGLLVYLQAYVWPFTAMVVR